MSNDEYQEKLNCSIRVFDLPPDYKIDEITSIFKNVGEVKEVKSGIDEVILTFADESAKEMAKMYDGCQVADSYPIRIEDASSFSIKTATQAQREELSQLDEKTKGLTEFQHIPETTSQYVPASRLSTKKEEASAGVSKLASGLGGSLLGGATTVTEAAAPLANIIMKTGIKAIDDLYSEQAKDFLSRLNETNVPYRKELPKDDAFAPFMKRDFFLSFIAIWSILWFLGALFF